ncbi:MAG TPA: class I SAM-dependent methyltransferase [Bryobacteraceae bacterium]|nr:class I SAM-dependent methyltransferase [Bryobacteraceae bacterium]
MDHASYAVAVLMGMGAFLAIVALDLHRRRLAFSRLFRLSRFAMLDLMPPALAIGLAVALGVTLYPEVADQGVVHVRSPMAIAMVLCLAVFPAFWTEGRKGIQFQRPAGLLTGEGLIFMGAATILAGLVGNAAGSRAVWFALPSLAAGGALIVAVVPPFLKKYEGLRILERIAVEDQFSQPEYTPPTSECPHPELWRMLDSQTTEVEVLDFLKTLVTTIKPKVVVETGTFLGHGTVKLAEGVKENGFGKVITIEFDPAIRAKALERFQASGLGAWIESRLESSLETNIEGTIDLLYSDSHLANREAEIRRLLPQLDPRGILVVHDASSHFKIVREAALRLEQEGLISAVLLSTPRGVVVAQRRENRK